MYIMALKPSHKYNFNILNIKFTHILQMNAQATCMISFHL